MCWERERGCDRTETLNLEEGATAGLADQCVFQISYPRCALTQHIWVNNIRARFVFCCFLVHVVNFKVSLFFLNFVYVFTPHVHHVEYAEMWRNPSYSVSNSLTCTNAHTLKHILLLPLCNFWQDTHLTKLHFNCTTMRHASHHPLNAKPHTQTQQRFLPYLLPSLTRANSSPEYMCGLTHI